MGQPVSASTSSSLSLTKALTELTSAVHFWEVVEAPLPRPRIAWAHRAIDRPGGRPALEHASCRMYHVGPGKGERERQSGAMSRVVSGAEMWGGEWGGEG